MRSDRYELAKSLIESGRLKVDTENGIVYSRRRNGNYKETNVYINPYSSTILLVNGKNYCFTIHSLVMIAAGIDISGKEINHKDSNKQNNRLDNLEVCTRSQNVKHMYNTYYKKIGIY